MNRKKEFSSGFVALYGIWFYSMWNQGTDKKTV